MKSEMSKKKKMKNFFRIFFLRNRKEFFGIFPKEFSFLEIKSDSVAKNSKIIFEKISWKIFE